MKANTITLHAHNKTKFKKLMAIGQVTRKQLDKELSKGIDSMKDGKLYSADEVDIELAKSSKR